MMPHRSGPRNGRVIWKQANRRAPASASRISRSKKRSLEGSLACVHVVPGRPSAPERSRSTRCPPARPEGHDPGKRRRQPLRIGLGLSRRRQGFRRRSVTRPRRSCARRPACAAPGPRPAGPRRRCSWTGCVGRLGDLPRCFGVEQDEVGRGALGQPAGLEAEDAGGVQVIVRKQVEQVDPALVPQAPGHRQHRLHADHAGGGLRERQALAVLVLRAVVAGDDVDGAVAQALDHRAPVAFAPQRRGDLGEGPVAFDLELVEREVVRGGVAGYGKAAALAGASPRSRPRSRCGRSGGGRR